VAVDADDEATTRVGHRGERGQLTELEQLRVLGQGLGLLDLRGQLETLLLEVRLGTLALGLELEV
jgi:hypothetical protein